ncbi:MAG: Nucleotide sugar dehydrogenase [candidate division TM6 bacterium GW2011_GWF2_37_49]|nr:MAG: Nucleotide sugar dehydrogenase [candidate division TM6 bacterium GW2011_GWF2_37_49]
MNKIVVVGAGYVGLVTGACLAQKGNFVVIVENNAKKIQMLIDGQIPFYEPGLDIVVQENIKNKRINFVSSLEIALSENPEIIFSCVGTPSLPDGSADLSYVWQVAVEIGKYMTDYCLIINKSTVPVGTAQKVKKIIKMQLTQRALNLNFDVASNPEFLKEGDALNDFLNPDRVVVGVQTKLAEDILRKIYQPIIQNEEQFLVTSIESAELAKYASNAMLATKISFINQMAVLAEKVGADISEVRLVMAKDKRIGSYFLNAGVGYGGSCFPKDIRALVATGLEYESPMTLAAEVEKINNDQRNWFLQKIFDYFGYSILSKNIGIWGLAFKPETDDTRCAPAIDIIQGLLERQVNILAYDPVASENIENLFDNKISYAKTAREVLIKSDFLIILTEWKEFLAYKPEDFNILKDRVIFDGRNCFNPEKMLEAGIKYFDVGRCVKTPQQMQKFFDDVNEDIQTNQI